MDGQPLVVQVSRLLVTGPCGSVELSASDIQVLSALIRAPGQSLERWQIAELISAGPDQEPSPAMIEMRIARLRKKLATAGAPQPCIKAMHKVGYALCCPMRLD